MNRLTKRYKNGKVTLNKNAFSGEIQETLDREVSAAMEPIQKAITKLAEYEDAEEKGQFARLPCKVDDTAYKISTGMILPSCILMIADKGNGYFAFLEDGTVVSLCDFGKTVFLTPEAAQQALKARADK